jgi:4-hydroxy-tetrahydrodipicolinate synthase
VRTQRLHGSLPALVTPVTPEREPDRTGIASLVARALADGATGVLVAGSTGEGTLLEPGQRTELTRHARAAIDEGREVAAPDGGPDDTHRATLVAGASGPTIDALHADVARLADAGADLVLVLAPHTYPLAPEELADLHREVADRAGVATLIYHIPQLTGSSLTPEVLGDLATHPGIVGMKDSSPDAARRATFVEATGDVDDFGLVTGHAPTLRAALEAGAAGSITAIANLRQWQVVALHEAVAHGEVARAEHLQEALTRVSTALTEAGSSVQAVIKAALQLDGVIEERWCRPPLRSVDTKHLDHVRTALMR